MHIVRLSTFGAVLLICMLQVTGVTTETPTHEDASSDAALQNHGKRLPLSYLAGKAAESARTLADRLDQGKLSWDTSLSAADRIQLKVEWLVLMASMEELMSRANEELTSTESQESTR